MEKYKDIYYNYKKVQKTKEKIMNNKNYNNKNGMERKNGENH